MSTMSITIATGPFYPTPPAPTGAVQRIWSDLATEFARLGHSVTILACAYPGQPAHEEREGGAVRILRRTGLRQGKNIYADILKDSFYSGASFFNLPRADILVTNAFWLPLVASLRPAAGKIVVSVARVPKGQLFLYRRVDRFHAVSDAIARAIVAELPASRDKVRVVPNPIDVRTFTPAPVRRASTDEPIILYTGRIHPEKGLDLLVRASAIVRRRHPGARVRAIGASRIDQGGGGPEYVANLRSLADTLGVPLDIIDPIFGREELAAALRDGDVYVYPSLAEKGESFGVAPLEAMATGLATIVSDLPCFREFMTPPSNGLVFDHRAGNPEGALADAIESVLGSPDLSRSLGSRGRETAERFGYGQVAREFLADFASLLSPTVASTASTRT